MVTRSAASAGLEHLPKAQRDVGIFGGIFGRLVDGDAVERQPRLAGADDLVQIDGLVIEIALRQHIEAVTGAAGVDRVGDQHGVVVRAGLDAAQRENLPVEFRVLRDLEHAAIFQQRLDGCECCLLGNLVGREPGAEQALAAALLAVSERDVAGFVRRRARAQKPQSCACIGSMLVVWVSIATTPRSGVRAIQAFEPLERRADLVFRAVDLRVPRSLDAGGREACGVIAR